MNNYRNKLWLADFDSHKAMFELLLNESGFDKEWKLLLEYRKINQVRQMKSLMKLICDEMPDNLLDPNLILLSL